MRLFINGIVIENKTVDELNTLLAGKVGVSRCFLQVERFEALLFHKGELIPVEPDFDYCNYDKIISGYTPWSKYSVLRKCNPDQRSMIVTDGECLYVMKTCEPDRTIEAVILANCDHPNIIKVIDLYVHAGEVVMILEYAGHGDLFDSNSNGEFQEHYETILKQISSALEYLHSRNIAHLDLKPDNIVVKSISPFQIALIDFGLSLNVPCLTSRLFGTPDYLPPEIAKFSHEFIYNTDCDIWQFGVMTLILYHHMQVHPFYATEVEKFKHGIQNQRIVKMKPYWPKQMPRKLEELARRIFVERSERPVIGEITKMLNEI